MAASSGGRGLRPSRSTDSTTDHARSTATSAPSRHAHRGGFAGRGHNERSAFVTIRPDVGSAAAADQWEARERDHHIGQVNSGLRAGVPIAGLSDCEASDPHHNNGAHDENTSTHHHT